jgi:hypothetical protein
MGLSAAGRQASGRGAAAPGISVRKASTVTRSQALEEHQLLELQECKEVEHQKSKRHGANGGLNGARGTMQS